MNGHIDASKIKIFFFDLDSTLYDHFRGGISERTYAALKTLKEKGYSVCLNSSRSMEELYNISKEVLELFDVLVLLDGAYISRKDGASFEYISDEILSGLISFFEERNITYRYCTDDGRGYLNHPDHDKEELFWRLYRMVPEVKPYADEKVVQILYYATGTVREELQKIVGNAAHFMLDRGGEISPAGTGKGKGMLKEAGRLGFTREEICAFGDSYNDIEMLKEAGLGIAVGNANDACKEAADYVTEHISDEGIAKALSHFGFIE